MKGLTILQLVLAVQNALGTIQETLPEFITEHLEGMDQLVKQYQRISKLIRENDGNSYQYRKQEANIEGQYYPVIRACFSTVSAMGKKTKYLYFKNETPSRLIKDSRKLKGWINDAIAVMEQPENNHLDFYRAQLLALQIELNQFLSARKYTRVDRKNIVETRRTIEDELKMQYQMLKYYVKGWSLPKKHDYRYYFDDLKLTSSAKGKENIEGDPVPELETGAEPQI